MKFSGLTIPVITTGTWSLHVDALGVATAEKTDVEADIRVGVAQLTSMWTGALSAIQLQDYDLLHSRDDACAFHLAVFSLSSLYSVVLADTAMLDAGR